MKRYFLATILAAGSLLAASAQNDPNRMLVVNPQGSFDSYAIDRVEQISFATVEGTVACDVAVKQFDLTSVTLDATRTEACQSFAINIFPGIIARSFVDNPDATKAYMEYYDSPIYYEDFTDGELTGIELEAGTEYAIVTQGIDMYGTWCEPRAAYFTTEKASVVGNPKVTATVTDATTSTISLKFEANADVDTYYYVIFEKGQFESQYEMFAPMFGFTNPGQMIQMWGVAHEGNSTYEYTYENLAPNTDYELYIQALDAEMNYAPLEMVECATAKMGGSGESTVEITIGDYKLADWGGEEPQPSQFLTFTPNDQTWCYRFSVYKAEQYDANKDEIIANLQSDPEMPMAYWFFYEPITTDFQIDPSTEAVAIASGKNADGVWGPVTEKRFTTPAEVSGKPARKIGGTIRQRQMKATTEKGRVPAAKSKVRLSH